MSDLISRDDAIEAIDELVSTRSVCVSTDECRGMNWMKQRAIKAIESLPAAEVTLCHLDSPCEYQNADIAMPSAQQWIPCSRELPKNMGTYWVTVDDYRSEERVTKLREYLGNENWERDGYEPPLTWMPLNTPKPWRGEEDAE